MADRIVVMNDGRVEQVGPPLELYDEPANAFVAGVLGSPAMNFFQGTVRKAKGRTWIETASGLRLDASSARKTDEGRAAIYGIRPEHLDIAKSGSATFVGDFVVQETTGTGTQVICDTQEGRLVTS